MFKHLPQFDPPQLIKPDISKKPSVFMERSSINKNLNSNQPTQKLPPSNQPFFVQSRFQNKNEWHNFQPAPTQLTANLNQSFINNPVQNVSQPIVPPPPTNSSFTNLQSLGPPANPAYQGHHHSQHPPNPTSNFSNSNPNPLLINQPINANTGLRQSTGQIQTGLKPSAISENTGLCGEKRQKQTAIPILSHIQSPNVRQIMPPNPTIPPIPPITEKGSQGVATGDLNIGGNNFGYQNENCSQSNLEGCKSHSIQNYVQSALDGLLVPYAYILAHQKIDEQMKKDADKNEGFYESSMEYFWNKCDAYDAEQMHNPRDYEKRKRKNAVVVKVCHKSKEAKIKMQNEEEKLIQQLKQEYCMQNYGVSHWRLNQEIKAATKQKIDYLPAPEFRGYEQKLAHQYSTEFESEFVQTSEFGQARDLEYQVDLRWLQEPEKIRRVLKKSIVHVIGNPTEQQIEEAIILDLKLKGLELQKYAKFELKSLEFKKYRPNILMRFIFGHQESQLNSFVVTGTFFEKKINLPPDYQYQPTHFKGFIVEGLKIRNAHGSITWPGSTDISDVCFEKDIRIGQHEVQCSISALEKIAEVQFFGFPFNIQNKSPKAIEQALKRKSVGATLLSFDLVRKKWRIRLDFGKQQKEAKRQQVKIQVGKNFD